MSLRAPRAVDRDRLGPLPGYPFTSRFTEIGGHEMHYIDEGPAAPGRPAVVLVHGNPTWSYLFRDLIRALAPRYRCVAPDHIGMGLSARPDEASYPHRLARRVEDLAGLIDRLDLGTSLTLIAHDWGGAIALGAALRQPERIGRLVLLNTAAFPLPSSAAVPWQLRLGRSWLGEPLIVGLNAFCRGAARTCARRGLAPEVRRAYLAPYRTPRHRRAVLHFVEDIPLGPADPSFAALRAIESGLERLRHLPTMILWGMRDFVFTPAFLEAWQCHLPEAEVHRFPDAGHYLLEDEAEAVRGRVEEFLGRDLEPAATERDRGTMPAASPHFHGTA